jgi:hypothetical protein
VAAIVLVAAVVVLAGASDATAAPSANSHGPKQARSAVLRYWTPKRLRNAKPSELKPVRAVPKVHGRPPARKPTAIGGHAAPPIFPPHAGGAPRPTTRGVHAAIGGVTLPWHVWGYGYRGAYAPVGRVFNTHGGSTWVCSGTLVDVNIVLTAAHCVQNGATGEWYQNVAFIPAVYGYSQPAGRWAARSKSTKLGWATAPYNQVAGTNGQGYYPQDYAFITLYPNSSGWNAGNYVGSARFLMNAPLYQGIYHIGYPAGGLFAPNCSGNYCLPWYCYAPVQRYDLYAYGKWDEAMSCFTGGGSSGGPFLQYWNGTWTVASVMSHSTDPYTSFGPYLDDATNTLYNYARAH